jgi:endonuclease/exonuclease/phosphatase family metal-dependent hydrolase
MGERTPGGLRVLSLNLLHGFPDFDDLDDRLSLVTAEILRQDADLVLLQEVPWTLRRGSAAKLLAQRTGMNYLYLRANGNRWAIFFEEGEAVLSRYPLRDPTAVELGPRAGFYEHRVVLGATAATPWGDLRVYSTHLTHGDPEVNRGQAEALVAAVSGWGQGPALIGGDFNATPDSPQIRAIAERWVDAFQAASLDDDGLTCCVSNLGSGPEEPLEKRIDYVFLAPAQGVSVSSSQRVLDQPRWQVDRWQWASDHIGLLITLDLGN